MGAKISANAARTIRRAIVHIHLLHAAVQQLLKILLAHFEHLEIVVFCCYALRLVVFVFSIVKIVSEKALQM